MASVAHDVRPTAGELEQARAVVEIALQGAERELSDGLQHLHVGLGWTDSPAVKQDFGGAIAVCDASDRVRVLFNTDVEDWSDAAMAATARGVGQAWLRARLPDERIAFQWQAVLATAAGISLATIVAPSTPSPWAGRDRLANAWPVLQPHLADSVQNEEIWSEPETPAYPIESLGACLASEVEVAALPALSRSEVTARLERIFAEA
jgi:hypothetical protein